MGVINSSHTFLSMVSQTIKMDLKDAIKEIFKTIYIIIFLYVAYQVLRAIFFGTWATENIIIAGMGIILAGMFTILTILINQGMKIGKINGILEEHLREHKK